MLTSYVTSLVRTGAALLVGWLLSLPLAYPVLAAFGLTDVSPAAKEKLVGGLVVLLSGGYYAAVHALEQRWPKMTVLLGSSRQPASYAPAADGTPVITGLGAGVIPPHVDLNGDLAATSGGSHAAPDPTDPAALGGPIPSGG